MSAIIRATGFLLLTTCSSICWAETNAPQVAAELNRRYADTQAACAVTRPAFYCSGVLVRALPPNRTNTFWTHDAIGTALGAESLAYLRADVGTQTLNQPSGVVFSSVLEAVAQGKSLDVLCAYPLVSDITGQRDAYGCAPLAGALVNDDPSSCAAVNVSTASQWLTHFAQVGGDRRRQCSFSTRVAAQFQASLVAHRQLPATATEPTELRVRNWNANAPGSLPISAVVYDVNQPNGLLSAQRDQLDYFTATGQWLPLLRLSLSDPSGKVFGFDQHEQLYIGYQVAARLNRRFSDTSANCGNGQASYYCNGVLIRAAAASPSFHAWDPSPGSVRDVGVSFAYLRADFRITSLLGTAGFIFSEFYRPVAYPVSLRCAYPVDAGTGAPDRCRQPLCKDQGVTSVATWRARYAGAPYSSCAFGPDAAAFQLNGEVRNTLSYNWHNEIIIAPWTQGIPEQIPLEAFFYMGGDLASAQFIQKDYYKFTSRFLPIVKVVLTGGAQQVFTFNPQEQSVRL